MAVTTQDALIDRITEATQGRDRCLIALAGPPASGKTTLADTLAARFGEDAVVLPMDGFHLDNATLRARDRLHRKGAPDTFDAQGFVDLLRTVRQGGNVPYPTFDRTADATVPDGGAIPATARIILVEGNYLLLTDDPWSQLAPLFDLTVRIDVADGTLKHRLVQRWLKHGLPPEEAETRATENDMRNVDYVRDHSSDPDLVFQPE